MGYVAAIPLLPAAVFVLFFLLPRTTRTKLLALPILAMAGSLVMSIAAFAAVWPGQERIAEEGAYRIAYTLGMINGQPFQVTLRLDPLAAIMLLIVTIVALCVEIYSLAYMHGEPRIAWYYAVLSLFTAAMLFLVLAGDYLLFYMSWEIMGLCSYLLIGFWHQQEEARKASLKAFLVTKVGDVGFALAIALIWATNGTFDIPAVNSAAVSWAPGIATATALLLMFGAMGKSAQVPLHVWLPDAMAGPTPASALIHAATMVAAGVFLVARSMPIFEASGFALDFVLVVGAVTALLAATMGAVQHNIKKVLAYSTISQLGYMFVGLGTGSVGVAMFHLTTHAFFKSLLFLGAGSIIHSMSTQDMREMGGVGRGMKWTTATFTIGTLALAGIVPFAGFFSKDSILDHLWLEGHYVIFGMALLTAGLTAFYMSRLWFRVFPDCKDRCTIAKPHESNWKMIAPMVVLSSFALVLGVGTIVFGEFVGSELEWPKLWMGALSTAFALGGIALGWSIFGTGRDTEVIKQAFPRTYAIVENKYFFDVVYEDWIGHGYDRMSEWVNWFDKTIINGVVNGVGVFCRWSGGWLRQIEIGRVQVYQRLMVGGVIVLMVIIVLRGV
jgi:NADH-quinone oxidoreductase subunit L